MSFFLHSSPRAARRAFLGRSGLLLSGAAVALLAGREALAGRSRSSGSGGASDVSILNSALASELEAIAAYQVGAESGLLQKPVLGLALQFQGHHKAHADVLGGTVRTLGGTPAEARARYEFPVETLKTQADVLRFAAALDGNRQGLSHEEAARRLQRYGPNRLAPPRRRGPSRRPRWPRADRRSWAAAVSVRARRHDRRYARDRRAGARLPRARTAPLPA